METPRESFKKILHYQQPERLFCWNWSFGGYGGNKRGTQFWQETVERWHQEGLPGDRNTPKEINDFFKVDRRIQLILRVGIWPDFSQEILEETNEVFISYNEDGAIIRQFKGSKRDSSMPEYLRYPITSRGDWEHFCQERLDPGASGRDQFEVRLDGETLLKSSIGSENFPEAQALLKDSPYPVSLFVGSLFGWPRNWMGLERLSYTLFDDEPLIAEIMDHIADLSLSVLSRILEKLQIQFDFADWWEDMAYNQGPLISPKLVERLMVPNYSRVNEYLRAHNIDVIGVDSDGNCEQLIPHWLQSGINCIFPNEVAAGNDVIKLRKNFGRDLLLIGGIDKRALIQGKKEIREELDRCLSLVAEGGFIPDVDHSVPPDISFENYLFYLDYLNQQGKKFLENWKPV